MADIHTAERGAAVPTTVPQALTLLRDYVAFHAPHGSECASRIPYSPPRGFSRRECDCALRGAKENTEIVVNSHASLQSAVQALQSQNEALMAMVRRYASECGECSGKGYYHEGEAITGRGPDDVFPDKVACPECADIRALVASAGKDAKDMKDGAK